MPRAYTVMLIPAAGRMYLWQGQEPFWSSRLDASGAHPAFSPH